MAEKEKGTAITVQMVAERFQMNALDLFVIRDTVAHGATIPQLFAFMYQANKMKLDPLLRQCYWIKDSFVIGIDGFRAIAAKTGQYRGQTPPQWCGDNGKWTDKWLDPKPPLYARVGVIREGFKDPVYSPCKLASYNKPSSDSWKRMPEHMLAKCSEAAALRKAFPVLSGIYSDDEMGVGDGVVIEHDPTEVVGISETQQEAKDALDKVLDQQAEVKRQNSAPAATGAKAGPFKDPAADLILGLRNAAAKGLDAFDQYMDRHMDDARKLGDADRARYDGEYQRLRQANFNL